MKYQTWLIFICWIMLSMTYLKKHNRILADMNQTRPQWGDDCAGKEKENFDFDKCPFIFNCLSSGDSCGSVDFYEEIINVTIVSGKCTDTQICNYKG